MIRQLLIVLVMGLKEIAGLSPEYIRSVLAAILAVFLGLLLKLASEWDKDRLTWKRAFTQSMFSSGIGYMVFLWLEDGMKFMGLRQELWLCITSFAAAHIVGALDTVSKTRAKAILENIADRIVAKHRPHEDDDIEQKDNTPKDDK